MLCVQMASGTVLAILMVLSGGVALVVEDLSTNTSSIFQHTPADFGPQPPPAVTALMVVSTPIDACGLANATDFAGLAVLFRADCCHNGAVPSGDCYYGDRSVIAQLGGGVLAIIANCGSDGTDDPVDMAAPALPLPFAPNITTVTIPSVSIGCDSFLAIMGMTGPVRVTADDRGAVWTWDVIVDVSSSQNPLLPGVWVCFGIVFVLAVWCVVRPFMCRSSTPIAAAPPARLPRPPEPSTVSTSANSTLATSNNVVVA